jgi:hypothetical protein
LGRERTGPQRQSQPEPAPEGEPGQRAYQTARKREAVRTAEATDSPAKRRKKLTSIARGT